MKILQVISYLYPAWSYGGPGKLVFELSKEMVKDGNRVTIMTTDAYDGYRRRSARDNKDFKDSSVNLVIFKNISNYLAYKFKLFIPVLGIFELIKKITENDVIHIHEFFTPFSVLIFLFSGKYNKRLVISAHGTLDTYHMNHRSFFKKIFMNLAGEKMIKSKSLFIAATHEEIEEYRKMGIDEARIKFVPNGIDMEYFHKLPERGLWRKQYQIGTSEKIILYLGRIHKLKGLANLITAYDSIKTKFPVKLVIAGSDDGYLPNLLEMVKKYDLSGKVIFPGIIKGAEKLSAYMDADVFVYPSPSEGFSIAILEAGACGLPLVITYGCKFPDVSAYGAGIISKPDYNSLKNSLIPLLSDSKMAAKYGKNAYKLIKNNYTITKMASKLENIYKTEA